MPEIKTLSALMMDFGLAACAATRNNEAALISGQPYDDSLRAGAQERARAAARAPRLCAEHDRQLGGVNPLSSLMVAKD